MNQDPYQSPRSAVASEAVSSAPIFYNLLDFSYQRNVKQAIVLYIVYLLILFVVFALLGGIAGAMASKNPDLAGLTVGLIGAIVSCSGLAITICAKKGLLASATTWFLFGVTLALSFILGGLGGLIPVAVLSTFANKSADPPTVA